MNSKEAQEKFPNAKFGKDCNISDRASIRDGASIGDGASIRDGASIGIGASIGDGASIRDRASIGIGASIGDGASIGSGASIGYLASIGDGAKFLLTIQPIGSRNAALTFWSSKEEIICCSTGCFTGTLDELAAAVEKTHGDNKHGKAYRAAIELIKIQFNIK